nr:MAG TPA: hypothetical protein [Caudoviricetes sp.]
MQARPRSRVINVVAAGQDVKRGVVTRLSSPSRSSVPATTINNSL